MPSFFVKVLMIPVANLVAASIAGSLDNNPAARPATTLSPAFLPDFLLILLVTALIALDAKIPPTPATVEVPVVIPAISPLCNLSLAFFKSFATLLLNFKRNVSKASSAIPYSSFSI